MKIVIATGIYPPESGGPATYTQSLALALRARGNEVTVVTYGEKDEKSSQFPVLSAQSDKRDVWKVSRRSGFVVRYLRYAWRVFLIARHADLVYLQGAVSEGLPGTIGAWLAGKPTIMRVPGDYAWEMAMQRSQKSIKSKVHKVELLDEFVTRRHKGSIRILEAIERWTARRARHLIVPSKFLRSIVQAWGVPEDRISIIYSTVQPLPPVPSRDELRRSFGVSDSHVVLTVVRSVPWKGVDVLIDALCDLPDNFRLVVAGNGPVLAEWKQIASDRHLESRVTFLGRVDRTELAKWYFAADVFALNSGYEGFPHVVVEAVTTGLPCLVSDKGGNPETKELFPEFITIVPYRDTNAWRSAMNQTRARLAPVVLDNMSFDKMVEGVLEILHKAVKVS